MGSYGPCSRSQAWHQDSRLRRQDSRLADTSADIHHIHHLHFDIYSIDSLFLYTFRFSHIHRHIHCHIHRSASSHLPSSSTSALFISCSYSYLLIDVDTRIMYIPSSPLPSSSPPTSSFLPSIRRSPFSFYPIPPIDRSTRGIDICK